MVSFVFVFTGRQFSRNFQTGVDNSSIIEVSELDKQHCVLQINSVNVESSQMSLYIYCNCISILNNAYILHTFFETADACLFQQLF